MTSELIAEAFELQKAGKIREAQAIYRSILEKDPKNINALQLLATTALAQDKLESAGELLAYVIKLEPEHAVAHHNIAYVYGTLGDIDKAMAHYRNAVRIKPNYAEAYFNLVNTVTIKPDDPIIPVVETQLEKTDWIEEDMTFLHFAAGKMFDDVGMYDRAFGHFAAGNRLIDRPYDADRNEAQFKSIANIVTSDLIASLNEHGNPSEMPVFVVGMPRSGTTLVEQILSGHPGIFGAGELNDVFAMSRQIAAHSESKAEYPAALRDIAPAAIAGFAKTYVDRITKLGGRASRVVDKQPLNLIHLGFISMLLPNARFIRLRRDPIDTCLSCFFQKFRVGNAFSFALADLGRFHRDLERLADHWHAVVPNRLLDVVYEELVEDPERIAREMVDFCGLEWDERCLAIENRERPIMTASRSQARQPIHRGSVHKWHRYRDQLGPLIKALGPLAKT